MVVPSEDVLEVLVGDLKGSRCQPRVPLFIMSPLIGNNFEHHWFGVEEGGECREVFGAPESGGCVVCGGEEGSAFGSVKDCFDTVV